MRYFNTAGPCNSKYHYMVPAAERLPEAPGLIEKGSYFVVHAPRQTGKTTTLRALARELTAQGQYAVLHFSCETGEPAGDNFREAQLAVLYQIRMQAAAQLPPDAQPPDPWPPAPDLGLLQGALAAWAQRCPRPLVLFFDEIDALRGEGLRAVLRQLRVSYPDRPETAPWAVVLCGLRDVRDYKAASGGDPSRLGSASPFNIKVKSIRLGDFDEREVRTLYAQHTAETGQPFTEEALARAFALTQGQPWLVNALAREIIEEMGIAPPVPISAEHMDQARERLILARATHLDSLAARLQEPRVRRVLEPLLAGTSEGGDTYQDDFEYVRDLGLIGPGRPAHVANPIYQEVIARVLADSVEPPTPADPRSFVDDRGRLDMRRILEEFAGFWREHGEVLAGKLSYHEVAPQLVLMAYLQRVVNGGGFVTREYGLGRGRIDLHVRWPYLDAEGQRAWQSEALELKVWRKGQSDPLPQGLVQLSGYMEQLGVSWGSLVIFDRRPSAPPLAERIAFSESATERGERVLVLRA